MTCELLSPNTGKYEPLKTLYLDTFHAVLNEINLIIIILSQVWQIILAWIININFPQTFSYLQQPSHLLKMSFW